MERARLGGLRAVVALALIAPLAAGCAVTETVSTPVAALGPLVYPPPPEQPRFFHETTLYGSGAVVEETAADRFKRFATGQSLQARGFAKPFGVIAHEGRVYVGDTVSRRVHVLDFPNHRFSQIGGEETGALTKPLGMALDAAGRLYVADVTARRVMVYAPDGAFLRAVGGRDLLERPSAVAVTPDGSRVYVLDTGGVKSQAHRIRVFDAAGAHLRDIGGRGVAPGRFNLPLGLTLAADGRLYVLDSGNFRVQTLSGDGAPLASFGAAGRFPGQFAHPKGLALDGAGNVYVTDTAFGVFQIFDRSGRMLLSVGQRGETGGRGRFLLPAGVAVDVDGRVYVADQFYRKVEVFRPAWLPADWPIGRPAAPGQ